MPWTRRLKNAGIIFSAALLFLLSGSAWADLQDERRITVGLRLFPALVAANSDLSSRVDTQGNITIVLLYRQDPYRAGILAERIRELDTIGGFRFSIEVAGLNDLARYGTTPPAGIFLAEWMPEALPQVVAFGINTHTVVFSPFRGDVSKGVLGGLYVSDRILPHINMRTLRASELRIKPFFLDVARRHDAGEGEAP